MKKSAFVLSVVLAAAGGESLRAAPAIDLNGVNSTQALVISSAENGFWINTTSPAFAATGSAHFHYHMNYNAPSSPANADEFDSGWNGQFQAGQSLGAFGTARTPGVINTTNTSLGGFQMPGEGTFLLLVHGDTGPINHFSDGNDIFRFKVDLTAPQMLTLRAQYSAGEEQPIDSGVSTGHTSPYFVWTATDQVNASAPMSVAVSSIRGYTWSFSASSAALPATSTATANYVSSMTTVLQMPGQAAGTYFFKVRAVDHAGNWSAPASFTFITGPDTTAPTVQSGSFSVGGVTVPNSARRVAVGLDANVLVRFSEPMLKSKMENAGLRGLVLRQLRNSQWQTVNATVPAAVTYDLASMTATLNPTLSLSAGGLYEIRTTTNARDAADNAVTPFSLEFMTVVDPAAATTLSDGQGASLLIPAQALALTGGVALNADPVGSPMASAGLSAIIQQANTNIRRNAFAQPLSLREINFYDTDGNRVTSPLAGEADLVLSYTDSNNDGIVDGSNPPVREGALSINRLDEELKTWVRVPGSVVDAINNTVTAPLRQFSVYGILGAPVFDLSAAYAFPVPFKPSLGHTQITFASLSSVATIKIYTADGALVRELHETNGDGVVKWNVDNDKGEPLASDIFFYSIENDQQQKTGKLIVGR